MTTFVLIAGGNLGGWVWRRVRPLLESAGHTVYAPTLTGLGERAHLIRPEIDLDVHVQDVLGVLEYEDLRDVTLVGHSYAGMVITGVADRAAARLAGLVYLDAVVPRAGESELDVLPPHVSRWLSERAAAEGDGWRVPPPSERALAREYGAEDLRWIARRMTDHPFRSCDQPLRLENAPPPLPRTFIHCNRGGFGHLAERAQGQPGWRYVELDAGHNAMVTAPAALADALLAAVATGAGALPSSASST